MYYNVTRLNAKYAQLQAPLQTHGGVEMEPREMEPRATLVGG